MVDEYTKELLSVHEDEIKRLKDETFLPQLVWQLRPKTRAKVDSRSPWLSPLATTLLCTFMLPCKCDGHIL
jgi:hypothetical protein